MFIRVCTVRLVNACKGTVADGNCRQDQAHRTSRVLRDDHEPEAPHALLISLQGVKTPSGPESEDVLRDQRGLILREARHSAALDRGRGFLGSTEILHDALMAFDRTLALLVFHPTLGAPLGETPLIDTTIGGQD